MKSLKDTDLAGKRVLVRVDFNVPMSPAGFINDDFRIQTALPTIEYLLEHNAKVILCSHLGRPNGERKQEFSLGPVAAYLSSLINREVQLAPDCVGEETSKLVEGMDDDDYLVMLENLRFHEEEQKNDPEFSRQLASLADVYINNAFAVSHRAHASVVGVTGYIKEKAAGLLLEKELDYFRRSVEQPAPPLVAIIGGAKVSGKLQVLENMLDRVDAMVIGGAMANTFLKSQGYSVGNSLVENDLLETAQRLLTYASEKNVKIHLPVDVVVAKELSADSSARVVEVQDIPAGHLALDIGPATVSLFQSVLAEARTIVWNGPLGAFEIDQFAHGTLSIAKAVGSSSALSITGGGDSNAAVKKSGEAGNISYMSTGGGAFLKLMEGKSLPGVTALTTK
ncbi:phosphoglycerate kinase [Desulfosediminicola ganghwensis]|uniref:phosphoglycerate kinase n=1 Tax=Desulfosediminicola ganghwensis TaxID=2569540 RepID=UPI001594C89A|nr:phosphoglycerate kinase [Desulfosediminicola ganghwensis]